MTGEEMERAITFILEQQAHTTAMLESLVETVDKLSGTVGDLSKTVESLSRKVDRNADSTTALLAIAEIQATEIKDLTESTKSLADRQSEAEERGRRIDERLDALITIIERHLSEGHDEKA